MKCPRCKRDLPGLGYYCHGCDEYTTDPGARPEPPYTFVLSLPPNMANGRMHWAEKSRKQQAYLEDCDRRYPTRPALALTKAKAVYRLFLWSPMDTDGAYARIKWPQDWLVSRSWIVDDAPDVLDIRVEQAVDRKGQRLEIVVEAA